MIRNGDQIIGCFALHGGQEGNLYTSNKDALVFKSLSIDARYQNKGHALRALLALPKLAMSHYPAKNEIILTVHHTNTPARKLYVKAGFLDKGLRFDGDYGEELIFHRDLL